jgi:hypothetical protein
VGAVEAGLDTVAQLFGGGAGLAGGFLGGLAGAATTGQLGTPQGAQGVEQAAAGGAERGTELARQGMRGLGLLSAQPMSETGQEYTETIGKGMQAVLPMLPVAGGLGAAARGQKAIAGVKEAVSPATEAKIAAATVEAQKAAPMQALREKATEAGIPLSPHQLVENKFIRMAGEFAENVPLSGSPKKARQEAFNAGLAKSIDPESTATKLTPDVFAELQNKAGSTIGEISARTPVPHDSLGDLAAVARHETPDVQAVVKSWTDDFAKVAEENDGIIPGTTLRKLRSEIQLQERGTPNGDLRRTLGNLTKKIDDALTANAADGDMPALLDARRQYAISKTLEPLVAKSANGDISPVALMGRVTGTAAGKHRMATGKGGELGDYARIGQQFIKEQASSGTAERHLLYGIAADVATAGKALLSIPFAAAYNKMGPRVAKWMIERKRAPAEAAEPVAAPAPPAEPTTSPGVNQAPKAAPEPGPLGDLTPNWETAPGASPGAAVEALPAEGLVPALGEPRPTTGPAKDLRQGLQIPAVPGRPDLPGTMVAGKPGEVGATEAAGAAMQTPEAALARQQQAKAAEPKPEPIPVPQVKELYNTKAYDTAMKAINKQHGAENAKLVERVAMAHDFDPAATEALAKKHESSPARFAKEIEAIIKKGESDATQAKQTAGAGQEPAAGAIAAAGEQSGANSPAAAGAERGEGAAAGGQGKRESGGGATAANGGKPTQAEGGHEALDLALPKIDEAFMREQQRVQTREEEAPAPSERGLNAVRDVLRDAFRRGMNTDGASLALWALDKNPNLARGVDGVMEGLKVQSLEARADNIAKGSYNSASQIITLVQGKDNPRTAMHEILHHSERMMPDAVQDGIRRAWERARDDAISKASPEQKTALEDMRKAVRGDTEAQQRVRQAVTDEVIDPNEFYQYIDPSEFWAVNGARIMHERFTGRGSWRAQARQWLAEMFEHIKDTVGLRSDAPILKALNEMLNPEKNTGQMQAETLIAHGGGKHERSPGNAQRANSPP